MTQAPTTAPAANHALAALQAGDSAPSVALLHDQEANVARQAEQNASSAAADKHKAAELARQQGALAFFTDTEGALKAYQRAAGYEPDDPDTLIFIGDLQDRLGQTQQALTTFDQARALLERKRAASPDNAALLSDLAVAHDRMGVEIQKQGNLESALAHFRQALAILQKLVQQDPGNQEWQRDLAVTHDSIGAVLQSAGKIADSLAEFRKAWRSSNRLLVTSPTMSISSSISHWRARASATAFSNKVT
jgi:tetratricopeptide (TPR) repeat protein